MEQSLLLRAITLDERLQPRVQGLNKEVSTNYSEYLQEHPKRDLPPVSVFDDGSQTYWLADGYHRHAAYVAAGRDVIPVELHEGGWGDALRYSMAANATHGLQRTNADKRRAVSIAWERREEWGLQSDRAIARACRVSNTFVGNWLKEQEDVTPAPRRKQTGRGGRSVWSSSTALTMLGDGLDAAARELKAIAVGVNLAQRKRLQQLEGRLEKLKNDFARQLRKELKQRPTEE